MGFEEVTSKVKKSDKTSVQFLRSLIVGAIATGVDVGLSMLLVYALSCSEQLAAAVGFVFGLAVNYFLSSLWVFDKSKVTNRWGEFIVFAAIGALGLLLKVGLISLFQLAMSGDFFAAWVFAPLNELIRNVVATGIVFIYNFAARKLILYRNSGNKKSESGGNAQ